jgi:transcriptional regulator with XRE-family HTH domain
MITGAQCRSARTLLTWSVGKLANAASVSESAVNDFELERQPPDAATVDAIQRVFEGVGVEFLPVDDVRLRADPSAGQVTPLNTARKLSSTAQC